jgi:hypothetical protein
VQIETVHGYGPRCHADDLGIEKRNSLNGPRSESLTPLSHHHTADAIAADLDHNAV